MSEAPLPHDDLEVALKLARRALRHPWAGIAVFVVGLVLTTAFVLLKPKNYLSESVLRYREGFQWEVPTETPQHLGQRLRDTLLARTRLEQLLKQFGLFQELVRANRMDDAIQEMRRRTVFRINEGDTFTIAYTGRSPEEAQHVTAALSEQLITENASIRLEQIDAAKKFLDDQRKRNEEALRAKETQLARFLSSHPELALEGTLAATGLRLGTAAREPERALDGVPQLPSRREEPALASGRRGEREDLLASAAKSEADLLDARRVLVEQQRLFAEKHPAVVAAAAAVKEAEEAHRAALDALDRGTQTEPPRTAPAAAPDAPVARPRTRLRRGQLSMAALDEYTRLTREVAEERDRFQRLDTRQFATSLVASSFAHGYAPQITVIDPAYVPTRSIGLGLRSMLAAGVAASLALALSAMLVAGFLDDRVRDRRDVEKWAMVRLLAEVGPFDVRGEESPAAPGLPSPAVPPALAPHAPRALPGAMDGVQGAGPLDAVPSVSQRARTQSGAPHEVQAGDLAAASASQLAEDRFIDQPGEASSTARSLAIVPARDRLDPRLLLLSAPDSPAAASFRVLRHRLLEHANARSILVTSAGENEGKTTCALNLALALAESRARVLLLEGNARRPTLATLLGLNHLAPPAQPPPQAQPWSTVQAVTSCLDVSTLKDDARPWFQEGHSVRARVEELVRSGYDFLIIDGPSILGAADANLLECAVSGVLLTIRSQATTARALRAAIDQMGSRKVLGAVLMRS